MSKRKYYEMTGLTFLAFLFYCFLVFVSEKHSFNVLAIYILFTIACIETLAEFVVTYSKSEEAKRK